MLGRLQHVSNDIMNLQVPRPASYRLRRNMRPLTGVLEGHELPYTEPYTLNPKPNPKARLRKTLNSDEPRLPPHPKPLSRTPLHSNVQSKPSTLPPPELP